MKNEEFEEIAKKVAQELYSLKLEVQEEIAYHWKGYVCQKSEMHKFDEDFDKVGNTVKDLIELKKSEENKKYLTFDELGEKSVKFTLNDNIYTAMYDKETEEIYIYNMYDDCIATINVDDNIGIVFFNALKLEVVEDED